MTRVVVGIDPGLSETGVVIMAMDYTILNSHAIKVKPSAAKRLYEIEAALEYLLSAYLVQYQEHDPVVFIEGYNYGATYQRESLGELGGVLRRWFYLQDLDYWVIPPNNLKKYVTGTGIASKGFMKKCTKEKWGLDFKSDDVCDAHGLARLGVEVITAKMMYHPTRPATQNKVVLEIANNEDHYRGANTAARNSRKKNAKRQSTTKG